MRKPKYPVRCIWPDGSTEIRSLWNVRGLSRDIGGMRVRPALHLEFDPDEIPGTDEYCEVKAQIRAVFGSDLYDAIPGSARPLETTGRSAKRFPVLIAGAIGFTGTIQLMFVLSLFDPDPTTSAGYLVCAAILAPFAGAVGTAIAFLQK